MSTLKCKVCKAVVPFVRSEGGKLAGAAVGPALGLSAKTFLGKIVGLAVPVLVGHAVDVAARPVCGCCGTECAI